MVPELGEAGMRDEEKLLCLIIFRLMRHCFEPSAVVVRSDPMASRPLVRLALLHSFSLKVSFISVIGFFFVFDNYCLPTGNNGSSENREEYRIEGNTKRKHIGP